MHGRPVHHFAPARGLFPHHTQDANISTTVLEGARALLQLLEPVLMHFCEAAITTVLPCPPPTTSEFSRTEKAHSFICRCLIPKVSALLVILRSCLCCLRAPHVPCLCVLVPPPPRPACEFNPARSRLVRLGPGQEEQGHRLKGEMHH